VAKAGDKIIVSEREQIHFLQTAQETDGQMLASRMTYTLKRGASEAK
jgi:hypothetical protein